MADQQSTISLPPLYNISIGHFFSRALALAAKLKLADLMKNGPRRCEDLAAATGTNATALRRVMRLLVSVGIFDEIESGEFKLTPAGEPLRTDVPGSMRAMVMLFAGVGIQDGWKELEYCVATGEPSFRKHSPDANAFTAMFADPEAAKIFDQAMATFTAQTSIAIAAAYDFSRFGRIADIGGGNGALMIGILRANPGLRGVVFDQPGTAERASAAISEAGLTSRCEAIGGDFFKDIPPGCDAYLLKHVIHDWNDDEAIRILSNCHRAMKSAATLIVAEGVYPKKISESELCRGATATDVNMLVSTGGRQRSEADFRALFNATGFRLTQIVSTPARLSLVEGQRTP